MGFVLEFFLSAVDIMAVTAVPAALALLLAKAASTLLCVSMERVFGRTLFIYLTAPGVMLHELGHALFCVPFGHRISELKLFSPRPGGELGHVSHYWDKHNVYAAAGNFFIAVGPIVLGASAIVLATLMMAGWQHRPPAPEYPEIYYLFESAFQETRAIFRSLNSLDATVRNWRFWVWVYTLVAVGAHMGLSRDDLKNGWRGACWLMLVLALAAAVGAFRPEWGAAIFEFTARGCTRFFGVLFSALLLLLGGALGLYLITAPLELCKRPEPEPK